MVDDNAGIFWGGEKQPSLITDKTKNISFIKLLESKLD